MTVGVDFDAIVKARTKVLAYDHRHEIAVRTDRLFAGLLAVQWVCAVGIASWLSPRTWEGLSSSTHPHVYFAIGFGGLVVLPPIAFAMFRAGEASTRYAIAVAQMLCGALLIHLTGGRIETHFHIFGSLAFLAFYRDVRVLLVASAVVVLDHLLRGALWPSSIYGVSVASSWRWVEHAFWVVFEDVFLVIACVRGQREIVGVAERHARLESQNQLEREVTAAHEANRAKSEFLANMSHEIRTPMTAIIGYADLLLDPELSSRERVVHIQTIRRNGEHLLSILNDILDLSKIEVGKMTVENVACSPSGVIVDVASLMRVRAAEKGLFFEVHYQTSIPETIMSDPTRLRQILMNLVGNAIKFTSTGGIRILARCDDPESANPSLKLSVVDTGVGMSKDQIGQLFQPFVQADSSTTRRFGGTGLGLAICRRLARVLGGDVDVDSAIGRGSVFELRVATGSLVGVRMLADLTEAGIPETGPTADVPALPEQLRCNVLLAEDGADNRLLISTHLAKGGATVVAAENGQIAVEKAMVAVLAGRPFDVILMDMQMPVMDGYAATSELRRKGYSGAIVALTAHAMAGDRERCISAGCTDYLTKPIGRTTLLAAVAKYAAAARGTAPRHDPIDAPPSMPPKASGVVVVSAESSTSAESPIMSEFAEDPDMSEIIQLFVRGLDAQIAALGLALERGNLADARRVAHQLKGAAGGYGFSTITDAAGRVEEAACVADDGAALTREFMTLSDLCRRARAA